VSLRPAEARRDAAQHAGLDLSDPELARAAFRQSIVRGLSDTPRWLSCRYLYDERGSALFERITEQPEYYPTRIEDALLARHAGRLRDLAGDTTLVELGSGSSVKTRRLLDAWGARRRDARYVAVDISKAMLAESCGRLRRECPALRIRGLAGTYEQALPHLRDYSPLVLLFLGSSLGNFNREETADFLERIRTNLRPGDHLLLGLDLVKDTPRLEAAYDDAAGVTAEFTRNLFRRMNADLGTDVDVASVEHVSYYNQQRERIDIFARFTKETIIALPEVGRTFRIAPGEMILTEVSRKFRVDTMSATAARHGFDTVATIADEDTPFALMLLRRRADPPRGAVRLAAERDHHLARARTYELIAPLSEMQLTRQHSLLMSPIVWDLGHIANFEEQWVRRAHSSRLAPDAATRRRDHLYDAVAHPRRTRSALPLLSRRECFDYLQHVRSETLNRLWAADYPDRDPLLRGGYVHRMLAQHEAQHTETILQTIQLIPDLTYEPPRRTEPRSTLAPLTAVQAVVPAGPFTMGTDDRLDAYDNERPAHEVHVERFQIDIFPTTNGQFLTFMEHGGYQRPDLWSPAGRVWLAEPGVRHPAQWLRLSDGTWWERVFGRIVPLALDQPVIHVSWYEADAYARWAGKRLPTEMEWEKAAALDLEHGTTTRYPWGDRPPTEEQANLDQRVFAPAAIGAYPRGVSYFGCHQMLGDVWEWTASDFEPYPGFEPFPYAEYSQVHFGKGYKVLRGGSWATQPIAIRNTFRNWDLPQRRQIFAGFRCAAGG